MVTRLVITENNTKTEAGGLVETTPPEGKEPSIEVQMDTEEVSTEIIEVEIPIEATMEVIEEVGCQIQGAMMAGQDALTAIDVDITLAERNDRKEECHFQGRLPQTGADDSITKAQ